MHPELFKIPVLNYEIKSYGFMLMLGFLTAIYMSAKRAERMRVNPDVVVNIGFCALAGGVIGARLFYVIHYWERQFAGRANPLFAAVDFSRGGMEFFGGLIGGIGLTVGYLLIKRESLRLYFDIITPGIMWGLAFGRMGCFLNGCCYGGVCSATVAQHWGVRFPYGSPAYSQQFKTGQLEVPAPLLYVDHLGQGAPLPRQQVDVPPGELNLHRRKLEQARQDHEYLSKLEPDSKEARQAEADVHKYEKLAKEEADKFAPLNRNLARYPSQAFAGQTITPSELAALSHQQHSLPVHPTQIYDSINALLGSLFLYWVLRVRRRHGMVCAIWLMTYPWTRLVLEVIRVDNPKDSFGLTVSQFISLIMIAVGVLLAVICYRLPEQSPAARPWEPPSPEPQLVPAQS